MIWKIAEFQLGDHIRVKRDHYYHHGIYVGNDEVVHYTGLNSDAFATPEQVEVRVTSVEFFLRDGVGEHAVYTRKEKRCLRKPEEIAQLARKNIGKKEYDFLRNNCETFANEMKYKKTPKLKMHHSFGKTIARIWYKATGWFAFMFWAKPRYYMESHKAKKEAKDIKGGAIIIANHTSIFDEYVLMFKYFFHVIHCMVAELVYRNKFVAHLCNVFENIKVDREDISNIKAIKEAKEYLNNGESVLIFPEGYLEKEKDTLMEIKPSAILLAFETGKPIIPYFIKPGYGVFKRTRVMVGEKIYIRDLMPEKHSLSSEDIRVLQGFLKNKLLDLRKKLNATLSAKTQVRITSKKFYLMDLCKVVFALPAWLFIQVKKIYIGDKKRIKIALKDRVILAPNHTSFIDCFIIYYHIYSRRHRIVALDYCPNAFLKFGYNRSGTIRYNRNAPGGFDLRCYKEVGEVLDGNGCVTMFPQGHITKDGIITEPILSGVATHSLKHNAPIIPIYFAGTTKVFRRNPMLFGDPIYPHEFFKDLDHVGKEEIDKFNDALYKSLLNLQSEAKKYRK